MEKRNTLLVITLVVFVFCTIYIGADLFVPENIEEAGIESINLEMIQNEQMNQISTNTTPKTTLMPQEEISPEKELVTDNESIDIAESDGANISIAKLAIFVSEDERKARTLIESVDLSEGCLDEGKAQDLENQWEFLENSNSYTENTLNISLKVESTVKINIDCISNMLLKILNDPRGWSTIANKRFQFTSFERSDFEIIFRL